MAAISPEETVLVVGAGPAGLALAIALHDKGFAVEIVERSPVWPAVGGLGVVHANGIRVLAQLGLEAAVAAEGQLLHNQVMCDQEGTPLSRTDLGSLWGDAGPTYGFDRPAMQRVLLSRASALPHRLGTAVVAIANEEDAVTVTFDSGEKSQYALMVGADGVRSASRAAVTPESAVYAGQMYYRAVSNYTPADPHGVWVMLGDGCFFGMVGLAGGRSFGFGATFRDERDHDQGPGRIERMRARFAGFGGGVEALIDGIAGDEQVHYGGTDRVTLPVWHRGRVVLVGDAAHCSQPMMAQGTSMALEDAVVLAEELHRHQDLEAALVAYEGRRMPRTKWVQEQTATLGGGMGMPAAARNPFLAARGEMLTLERFRPLLEMP